MTPPSDSATKPPSIWILTNGPTPNHIELFSAIAARPEVRMEVHFLRDSLVAGPDRNFNYQICRTWLALTSTDELRFHGRPIREAAFGQHDLYILSGLYTSVTFLASAWILYCRGQRWAIWWERPRAKNKAHQESPVWRTLHSIKESIRRWLLMNADLVICSGTAAVVEYQAMGVEPDRTKMLTYCCDVSRYAAVPVESRVRVRNQLGVNNQLVFLFSGQMIPRKGVDVLIQAFTKLAEIHADVALVLLGEGSDRLAYESMVPESLRLRIHFLGHQPQSLLPDYFAAADVFSFPSRHDGWALVMNEACGAGLPIIATNQTGATHDLVREGENGFRVEADDVAGLFDAMNWCSTHRDLLPEMGRRSRELVQPFSHLEGARMFTSHITTFLNSQ